MERNDRNSTLNGDMALLINLDDLEIVEAEENKGPEVETKSLACSTVMCG